MSLAELVFFICGPLALLGAAGLVVFRKAVHAALSLAFVMINLAVMYAALEASLLAAAQVIVYTGAILMLFLFVIMLVGIDREESHAEPIKGQTAVAVLAGLGTLGLIAFGVGSAVFPEPATLAQANAAGGGNVESLAALIFGEYVFAFEYISALMIIAPVGAMVLAQHARLVPKSTQRTRAAARIEAYATSGTHPGTLPNSGILALHNSIATPALLPDGSVSKDSVSPTMIARDAVVHAPAVAEYTKQRFAELEGGAEPAVFAHTEPLELIDTDEERQVLK